MRLRVPMIERDLYDIVSNELTRVRRREDETALALMAGEEGMQMFGKPFKPVLEWPEGLPLNFKSVDEMQAWARAQLAERRAGGRP